MTRVARFAKMAYDVIGVKVDSHSHEEQQDAADGVPAEKVGCTFLEVGVGEQVESSALKETVAEREAEAARLTVLRDRLITGLNEIPHSALNGDAEKRLPGNVNFCFEGIEGESLLLLLDEKGISASSGSACTSGSLDPSHVLLAIGRIHDVAHGSLRLTLGRENTPEDVEYIISAVKDVVAYLRGFSPVWRDLQNGKRPYIL